jgi:GABA permease
MVVMRRYLVVANQTLQRAELRDELRKRTEAEPSWFYLLVPDTPAADYPSVPAVADVLQPGMTWWATDYRGPASDEAATAQARQQLCQLLAELSALGIPAEGDLGSAHPLEAIEKALADHQFDEIIVATLPRRVSRWLRSDLPHQAGRRFNLPVTTIITSY